MYIKIDCIYIIYLHTIYLLLCFHLNKRYYYYSNSQMINEEEKQDVGDIENNDEDFIAKMSDMTLKGEDQVGT